MGILILEETTKNPITLMGKRAGLCWGADTSDDSKNYKRGLDCLNSNHGRVMEFVNVETVIDGYSARVIREWYTHIGGSPTRVQASTRYIDYENFYAVVPYTFIDKGCDDEYAQHMQNVGALIHHFEEKGVPREDVAMLLPLGMTTKIVDKRNLRNIIDMSHQRLCNRAYWEFRNLLQDYLDELSYFSEEWDFIVKNYMKPKCEVLGYCPETHGCGNR